MIKYCSRSLSRLLATLFVAVGMLACVSTPDKGAGSLASAGNAEFTKIDELVLVDCLLPGQIRQLGTKMTFVAPRRRVKATKADCGIRGGEFVLYDRSDYDAALQALLPQAKSGDALAQTYVGEIYEKGLGLPGPDYSAAARWYRAAAVSGHRPAQTSLGSLYERGLGVPKDKSEALDWYRKATGLDEDRLIFESKLKAERAAFQQEIALRNRVVASLQSQLQRSRSRGSSRGASTSAPLKSATAAPSTQELERVATSLQREASSEAERVQREMHAVEAVKKAEGLETNNSSGTGKKAAQMGKLELSLRQQSDALSDTQNRLSMVTQ